VFDIGTGEILALAVLALLVLGPDKLPRYAADAARFIRQMRNLANDATSEVRRELGPELEGLELRELDPRSLVRKHLLDGLDDDDSDGASAADRPRASQSRTSGEGPTTPPAAAPYDPDTT
jgi:sec-independent protein translocase protein TatB